MKRTWFYVICSISIISTILLIMCGELPTDPSKVPDNVKATLFIMNSSGTNYQDQAVEIGLIIRYPNMTKQVRILFPDNLSNDTLFCDAMQNENYDTLKITRTFNIYGKKTINVDVELTSGLIKPFSFVLEITPKPLTELTVVFDTMPQSSDTIVTGMPDTMLFVASTSPAGGAIVFTVESQPALDLSGLKIITIGSKAQVITTAPKDTIYNITVTAKSGITTKSLSFKLTSKPKLILMETSSVSSVPSGTSDTLVFTIGARQSDTVNSVIILNAAAFKTGEIVPVVKGNDTLSFIFTPVEAKNYTFSVEVTINNKKDTVSYSISVTKEATQLLKQDTVTISATEGEVLNVPLVLYLADTTVQLSTTKGSVNSKSLIYTVPISSTKDTVIITVQKNSNTSKLKIYLNISKSNTPKFTVIYLGNGSTSGSVPVDTNKYQTGASVTVAAAGTLVKAGYTFTGWNTVAAGSGTTRAAGITFTKSAINDTLYAQWTTNPTFTVTYNVNGNSGGIVPVDSNKYEPGASVTVATAGTLAKAGYTFAGWNTAATGSGIVRAAGALFTKGAANDTFYAQWTIASYSITYTLNDGTNNTANPATYIIETPTITLSAPTKVGYSFIGWYSNAEFSGTAVTSIVKGSTGDVSLFANWERNHYTVTFNTQSGSAINPVQVSHGSTVTRPSDPTRTGYYFGGWYKENTYDTLWNFSIDVVTAPVALYTKWVAIPTHSVTYNGNTCTGGNIPASSYQEGATITVAANSFTRNKFIFNGWNTAANGSGQSYATGAFIIMNLADITLYAQWKPDGMVLISAKAKSFNMGEYNIATPVHTVNITKNYWLDATEVTIRDYTDLMTTFYGTIGLPDWNDYGWGYNLPAYGIAWDYAALYCNVRTKASGSNDTVYTYASISSSGLSNISIDLTKSGFRLPTEAEWEYACRAGTSSSYFFDNSSINNYAWYTDNSTDLFQNVGSKYKNSFGLFDMSGSVAEWCNDWLDSYPATEQTDPTGPVSVLSTNKVYRGGSIFDNPDYLYSAYRDGERKDYGRRDLGFRVCLPVR